MQRIPETELMNDDTQAVAYANADFSEAHDRFVALFREKFSAKSVQGMALDLGCGPADVTVRFAKALSQLKVVGVDGSAAMLKYGRERIVRENLAERVALVEGYLPGAKLPVEKYDVVISNSLLHHLADPQLMWTLVKAHAKPQAGIFIMDLLRPDSLDAAQKIVARCSGNEPEILKTDFYNSLLAAYTVEEIQDQLKRAGLNLTVEAVTDRHLIVWGAL